MKTQIGVHETVHLVGVQRWFAGELQFVLQYQNLVRQFLEPLDIGLPHLPAGGFAHCVVLYNLKHGDAHPEPRADRFGLGGGDCEIMSKKLVSGVYPAAITPRDSDGKLDERALRKELDFLIGRGIRGFAINGATGEYCLTTANELSAAVAAAAEVTEL